MLILNPQTVRFGQARWPDVSALAIDRRPRRIIEEWTDTGPYPALVDCPEQRIRITIIQELAHADPSPPRPGDQATLSCFTAPARAESARRKVSTTAVILEVRHELSHKKGALRTITLAAISGGQADPITITDAPEGEI
jgi:hypothetical protein